MKKIILKEEACIGCGACVGIDSEHFDFNEDGYSTIKSQENLESPALSDAIEACPVAIISIEEQDTDSCQESEKECSCETCGDECSCGNDCNCEDECSCTEGGDCSCESCQCHEEK